MTAHLYIGDITVRCTPIHKGSRLKKANVSRQSIPLILEKRESENGKVSYVIPAEHLNRKLRWLLTDRKKKELIIKKENWNMYRFIYEIPPESVKFSSNLYKG